MPHSDNKVRHALLSYLRKTGLPQVMIDIGPGSGFYGKALRSLQKNMRIYGIEIWESYINKYKLKSIYDKVFCADMRVFDYSTLPADLVILADIVEHIPKSDAISLFKNLKQNYKWLLITIPILRYEQSTFDDNPYEAHLHQWTKEEIIKDLGMTLMQDCGLCGLFEWNRAVKLKKVEYTQASFNFKVHVTRKKEDGTFIDSSLGKEPLQFTAGQFQFADWFEEAVLGKMPGESKTIYISADKAFGDYRNELVEIVSKDKLPATLCLEVGNKIEIQRKNAKTLATIIDIDESTVTLDANHPLAGENLIFDIQVIENN